MKTCQFCSEISLKAGESPIGTANKADYWFLIELPQPWARDLWSEIQLIPKEVYQRMKKAVMGGNVTLSPLAIAPEKTDQQVGYRHILYYYRPGHLFAEYQKQEYLVPETRVKSLVTAIFKEILGEESDFSEFHQYQQTFPSRDLLICTHGNVDTACSRFGYPLYRELREQYSNHHLRIWRCSHFGGHRFAPTAISLPDGRYWGHLTENVLDALVNYQGSISDLAACLRGWAGLNQWAQIAEREIWLQEGWQWLNYLKAGEVIEEDEIHHNWATIRIFYAERNCLWQRASLDRATQSSYEADIETIGELATASQSGSPAKIMVVKQYQVKNLRST